jgi:hypothetical protein
MEKIYIISTHCLPLPIISTGKAKSLSKGCNGKVQSTFPSIPRKISDFSRGNHGVRGRDYGGERYI